MNSKSLCQIINQFICFYYHERFYLLKILKELIVISADETHTLKDFASNYISSLLDR